MTIKNEFGQEVGDILANWTPRQHPERITLEGRYCILKPLHEKYAADLFAAYQLAPDTRSWTYLVREPESTEEEYRKWVLSVQDLQDPIHFAVIDKESGKPVGSLSFLRIDSNNGVVEVGHVHFSPLLSRTRMATEAQWLMMQYAFEKLGYRRYEWKCDSLNGPSRKAALRLGFLYEGCFRKAVIVKGKTRDTTWYAMVDDDWPKVNNALKRWLDPENFDKDGLQKQSLESFRD